MIYTKSATQRIITKTKNLYVEVLNLEVWDKVVRVTYRSGSKKVSTLISKKLYLQEFVDFRKEGAKNYRVEPTCLMIGFTVVPKCALFDQSKTYQVTPLSDRLVCTCEDYKMQKIQFGKGMCKHGYTVLNHLGYDSLTDYVQRRHLKTA